MPKNALTLRICRHREPASWQAFDTRSNSYLLYIFSLFPSFIFPSLSLITPIILSHLPPSFPSLSYHSHHPIPPPSLPPSLTNVWLWRYNAKAISWHIYSHINECHLSCNIHTHTALSISSYWGVMHYFKNQAYLRLQIVFVFECTV